MLTLKTKSLISGALAGIVNGFLGTGGGMLLIPLLTRWLKIDERCAFATSVCIILPLCATSATIYWLRCGIDLPAALPYLIGGLIGGFAGGRVFQKVPTRILHGIFGLLIIYGGIRTLL